MEKIFHINLKANFKFSIQKSVEFILFSFICQKFYPLDPEKTIKSSKNLILEI